MFVFCWMICQSYHGNKADRDIELKTKNRYDDLTWHKVVIPPENQYLQTVLDCYFDLF